MGKISKYAYAALLGLQVSPLWAADMALKAEPRGIFSTPVDPYSGVYIIGLAGYGWDRGNLGATFPRGPADFGDLSNAPQGYMAGGGIGVGTRIPRFLGPLDGYLGGEGMGIIGNLSGTAATPATLITPGGTAGLVASTDDKWFARAVARFGFIYENVLVYGDAGWGWGNTGLNITTGGVTSMGPPGTSVGQNTGTENGFTWGAGIEFPWFFGPNWKARFQYVQFDFGTNAACILASCATAAPIVATQRNHIDAVLAGISYRFGP